MRSDANIKEIFEKYRSRVYRLALSITRNESDAQDVMQNTFLKIIKNLAYFRNKSQLSTWIYRITYNEALMYLRKKKSQFKLSNRLAGFRKRAASGMFVNWTKLPDEELLSAELKNRIDSSIKHMPIQYRMAFLLSNVEGLPLKESAKILNLKLNSLKTRIHRGRLLIKKDITDYFKDRLEPKEQQDKKCGIWTRFVYDYTRGSLGKLKQSAFNTHINDCDGCKDFLNAYNKAIDITGALECRDIPPELADKIETFLLPKHLNTKKGRQA